MSNHEFSQGGQEDDAFPPGFELNYPDQIDYSDLFEEDDAFPSGFELDYPDPRITLEDLEEHPHGLIDGQLPSSDAQDRRTDG